MSSYSGVGQGWVILTDRGELILGWVRGGLILKGGLSSLTGVSSYSGVGQGWVILTDRGELILRNGSGVGLYSRVGCPH